MIPALETGGLFGVLHRKARRLPRLIDAMTGQLPALGEAQHGAGWGLGYHHMGRVFIQKEPLRGEEVVHLGALVSRIEASSLAAVVTGEGARRWSYDASPPMRLGQWLHVTPCIDPDLPAGVARVLDAGLPGFVRREPGPRGRCAYLFRVFMGNLYGAGMWNVRGLPAVAAMDGLARAMVRVAEVAGGHGIEATTSHLFTNGEILVAYSGDLPTHYCHHHGPGAVTALSVVSGHGRVWAPESDWRSLPRTTLLWADRAGQVGKLSL